MVYASENYGAHVFILSIERLTPTRILAVNKSLPNVIDDKYRNRK